MHVCVVCVCLLVWMCVRCDVCGCVWMCVDVCVVVCVHGVCVSVCVCAVVCVCVRERERERERVSVVCVCVFMATFHLEQSCLLLCHECLRGTHVLKPSSIRCIMFFALLLLTLQQLHWLG